MTDWKDSQGAAAARLVTVETWPHKGWRMLRECIMDKVWYGGGCNSLPSHRELGGSGRLYTKKEACRVAARL